MLLSLGSASLPFSWEFPALVIATDQQELIGAAMFCWLYSLSIVAFWLRHGRFQDIITLWSVTERASCKRLVWCCVAAFSEWVRDPPKIVATPVQAGEQAGAPAPAAAMTQSQQAAAAGEQAGTSHLHLSQTEDAPGQLRPPAHEVLYVHHESSDQT